MIYFYFLWLNLNPLPIRKRKQNFQVLDFLQIYFWSYFSYIHFSITMETKLKLVLLGSLKIQLYSAGLQPFKKSFLCMENGNQRKAV